MEKNRDLIKSNRRFAEDYPLFYKSGFIYRKKMIKFSRESLYLTTYMNGQTSDDELMQRAMEVFGFKVKRRVFERLLYNLKRNNLLVGRNRGCLLSKLSFAYLEKVNNSQKMRKPSYAGYCYPNDPRKLRKMLKICFSSVNPERLRFFHKNIKKPGGIIIPHSNIKLSGSCAAWAYKALSKWPLPDLFIILGPDHSSFVRVPYSVLPKDFYTPLGPVMVDKEIAQRLADRCSFDIFSYNASHLIEHSIEIQLPFLQYIYKEQMDRIRILPVICGESNMCNSLDFAIWERQFIKAIRELIHRGKKRIILIASGDLAHRKKIGFDARFHKMNKQLIGLLRKGKAESFKLNTNKFQTCCGRRPFYTALKVLTPSKGLVLDYSWSFSSDTVKLESKYLGLTNIGFVSIMLSQ